MVEEEKNFEWCDKAKNFSSFKNSETLKVQSSDSANPTGTGRSKIGPS